MPRQDVPYGGAICRLKERIAEIWDKLGEKLHSVNGVEGDAAGNVKIVSADPAVVITNNAASHEIEIGLDSLELPSAAVTSVNGQTGAVALDAGDINVVGGSNVQDELDDLDADVQQVQTDIAQEALARANADSALQANINAALASIPEMSVTPDPYKGVERDAQGRAFAADPASGATDKSLVTSNWISQTGSGKPNNVLHDTGNEIKTGNMEFQGGLLHRRQWPNIDNFISDVDITTLTANNDDRGNINWYDMNGVNIGQLRFNITANGRTMIQAKVRNSNGTFKYITLALGDTI